MKTRLTQWIILGLLILMIFHPVFYFKKRVSPYGISLIDKSESMNHAKKIEIKSPFTLKDLYFGEKENGTDIGKAILTAVKTYADASFIILYSDGSNTKGENPIKVASKLGIPVYFVFPELTAETNKGFISVYGPSSVVEGDSVKLTVYYKTPNTAMLEMNYKNQTTRKKVIKEGILDFSLLPSIGKNNIQLNLLIENDTADRTNWALDVKKKRRLLIISEIPNWNYKFIKRYFEDKGWNTNNYERDTIDYQNFQDFDMLCLLDNPDKYKENIGNYLKEGGNILMVSSASSSLNFLPVIASTVSKYSGKLPESYYLKAGGIKRNSSALEIDGEIVGYSMPFGEGTVIQFTYLELWKLALSAEKLYPENLFEKLMGDLLRELTPDEIRISYSKKLLEGEDFILRFNEQKKSVKTFFWDGQKLPITEDYITIREPLSGLHHFKIELPSNSIEGSVMIVGKPGDKMGIDTLMLSGIGDVSGGGKWSSSLVKENPNVKEREIWINLRHNWFFISLLLLLLFLDWFLWMRTK